MGRISSAFASCAGEVIAGLTGGTADGDDRNAGFGLGGQAKHGGVRLEEVEAGKLVSGNGAEACANVCEGSARFGFFPSMGGDCLPLSGLVVASGEPSGFVFFFNVRINAEALLLHRFGEVRGFGINGDGAHIAAEDALVGAEAKHRDGAVFGKRQNACFVL